jgi:hypothetical protein
MFTGSWFVSLPLRIEPIKMPSQGISCMPIISKVAIFGTNTASRAVENLSHNYITIDPSSPETLTGWAVELSPTGRYSLRNSCWGYALPGFSIGEAQRAVGLLGDASRWPDHGSAFVAIEACWGIIAGGAE